MTFYLYCLRLEPGGDDESVNDGRTLHIRGLHARVRDVDLKELFERFGPVESCE